MIRLAALLTFLALAGCGAAADRETKTVDLGAEITLAPGAVVSVKATGMTMLFVAVTEDSRCPVDSTCVWAGEVRAVFEVHESSQAASRLELLEGTSTVAGGCRVTLVRVEPQPTSTARIAPQDYRATLKFDKAG
jgi:hypothetical protein